MKILDEFRNLIPPLQASELEALEVSLLGEGCRDRLVVWGEVLLDGHNRLEICEKHGIPYKTKSLDFGSQAEARDWILRNALARRNLTPAALRYLRGKLYQGQKKPRQGKVSGQFDHLLSTSEKLGQQFGVGEKTIRRDGDFAKRLDTLPSEKREAILRGSGKSSIQAGPGSDELYTPAHIIEAARTVLGTIDLDPASCDEAQQTVQATHYYTQADNGLTQPWEGRVWLNPPYSRGLIESFCDKFVHHWLAGDLTSGLVLTHNCTETSWFQLLAASATLLCFPRDRVRFTPSRENAIDPSSKPTRGQTVFFFGDAEHFAPFHPLGLIMKVGS